MDKRESSIWSHAADRFPRNRKPIIQDKRQISQDRELIAKCLYNYPFRKFMEGRGFTVNEYQYKVLTSWKDDKYFRMPITQHDKDYENHKAERVREYNAYQLKNMCRHMGKFKIDTKLPAKLEPLTREVQGHRDIKPVNFDLLMKLFPNYGKNNSEAADIPTTSLYNDLPGPDWIRLLVIEPKGAGSRYYLRSIHIEDAIGGYDALSYCWGDTQNSNGVDVMCNGFQLKIGRNLALALRNLQFRALPRIIWVDALCINQEDFQERSSQVRLMRNIYSQASRTIMFLGDIRQNDSLAAFDLICNLVNNWDQNKPASFREEKNGRWLRRRPIGKLGYFANFEYVERLAPLFNAEWFERRWVIQEAVLSPNAEVLVPGATINWKWIGVAAAILRSNYSYILDESSMPGYSKLQKNIYNAYLMARLSNHAELVPVQVPFLVLLRLTAGFQTTKDLDIVYSLLGLSCQDDCHPGQFIVADYSLSYCGLMKRVVEKLMTLSEPLAFLSDSIGAWRQRSSNTPSWTPTWSMKDYSMLDPWGIDQGESAFSPARDLPFKRWTSEDILNLVIDGIYLSDICWVSNSFSGESSFDSAMRGIFFLIRNFRTTVNDKERASILSRTMTGGRDGKGNPEHNRAKFCGGFVNFLLTWHRCYDGEIPELHGDFKNHTRWADDLEDTSWFSFVEVARVVCGRRRLFLTSLGHVGLGPETILAGDVVCVFGGATMPHILRKVDDHNILIGDCFIDNLMEGEAVIAMQKKDTHIGPVSTKIFLEEICKTPPQRLDGLTGRALAEQRHHLTSLCIDDPEPLKVSRFTIR